MSDDNNRSALKDFIASIATISGDLSSITAPPFILASRSATEYPSSWAEFPEIFTAPAREKSPEKRALLVLKWYITSLKRQQYTGGKQNSGIKKPLNPFLGELFLGKWDSDAGTTLLLSEQVSHHPPVTACFIVNDREGVQAEGYTAQEITFSKTGSVSITQTGHAMIYIPSYGEKYLVTLPSVLVKGILTGSLYPELNGKAFITSTSGFTSEIDFSGTTLGFGRKNAVHAVLFKSDSPEEFLYEVYGQWNEVFSFKDKRTGEVVEVVDTNTLVPAEIQVADLDLQDVFESRKAWQHVIAAVNQGDMRAISEEKSKIEDAQRAQRAEREKTGTHWEPLLFSQTDTDEDFEKLAQIIGQDTGYDKTGGAWKYDNAKWKKANKPFHGGLDPAAHSLEPSP